MAIDVNVANPVPQGQTAFGGVPLVITRPANQTAYTAADVVGNAPAGVSAVLPFANMGPVGGRILLTSVQMELDIASIPAGMTSFRLYLYNAPPPSAILDNGAWLLAAIDRSMFIGYVDLGSPVLPASATVLYVETNIINKQIKLLSSTLYGYLVTAGGYTPAANSEVYTVTLHSVAV